MKFKKHSSEELVRLFNNKPYQGQSPEKAHIVFISSDANYSPEISNHDFFKYILEYQADGVEFWNKHGEHHPFLLKEYPFSRTKDGVPFHRNFKKIGLNYKHSSELCFLELLDVPTIGNKSDNKELFNELISYSHLKYIDELVLNGGNKLFFISSGVISDMLKLKKKHDVFGWLEKDKSNKEQITIDINSNKIKEIYHFSAYQIHSQVEEIYLIINRWLEKIC